jgi:hypothetical protein
MCSSLVPSRTASLLSTAPELEAGVIVADIDLDGLPRGGIDGELVGRGNPAVTAAFLGLWEDD